MPLLVPKTYSFRKPTLQDVNVHNASDADFTLLGGVFNSDLNYVWHAKGPSLEVRCTTQGIKVGSWTFGSLLKDSSTEIICVDEIKKPGGRISLLAVGVNCSDQGLVCVFDIFTSRIIRAIQIPEKISSLHMVDSGCDDISLPGVLKYFQGTIGVGTHGGNVYLLDLCRQACEDSLQSNQSTTVRDELRPCEMVVLQSEQLHKISKYIDRCVRNSKHLAIHLNAISGSLTEHFTLKGPKGDDRIHVNRDEVEVSSLYFSTQLTSLLVGYNFGAFQIWNLQTCDLFYTSPVCEEHIPVTHFAVQEPSDDPKAYCYVWASYSNARLFEPGLPYAIMYSLYFEDRVLVPHYGYVYKDFQHCSIRFQIELTATDHEKYGASARGGYCMGIESVAKSPVDKNSVELLCSISWCVWFNEAETQTSMLLFDLNQWYKEQMPNVPNWDNCATYMIRLSLSDHLGPLVRKNEKLLDIKIDGRSINQFVGVQRLEEHFCPTSLSFDVCCLCENSFTKLHNQGKQHALLSSLVNFGPLCILKPKDLSQEIVALGLTPLFCDIHGDVSLETQREVLLNVALEQNLTGWLYKCASEWANGSFSSSGCTLTFLLNWAFQRACALKTSCDQFCRPLFDYSESRLDDNTNRLLYNCSRQIGGLLNLYEYVLKRLEPFIPNYDHVNEQFKCIQNVTTYYEVLLWLANVGLLPECHPSAYPKRDENERISAPYPVDQLVAYYDERRVNLQQLCGDLFINSNSLLFIDNLVVYKCGAEKLQKQWQEDGGSGQYPPSSLQSLLRTYLIENVSLTDKHSLVAYLFLDVAMVLNKNRYGEVVKQLLKFSNVFNITLSVIKIIQGFWHLDHGDFVTALENIFDPNVLKEDLQHWHDIIILRSFITQNQFKYALQYLQVRKPVITEEKDVIVALSILVANNMLDDAFNFIKQSPDNNKYLTYFFNECNKKGKLSGMLYKYLEGEEEKAFIKYLQGNGNPKAEDLQVFYYLLRSRFPEALDSYEHLKRKRPECQGLIGQRNASKTDHIFKIYKNFLPDINKKFVDVVRKERVNLFNKDKKPRPLSVNVQNTDEKVRYKSSSIFDALTTAKATFNNSFNIPNVGITEQTPFLRTPKALIDQTKQRTPVINSTFIELDERGEYLGPSPPKKLKLSPRLPKSSPTKLNESIHSRMSTPVVKRRRKLGSVDGNLSNSGISISTPHSILKVRGLSGSTDQDLSLKFPSFGNTSELLLPKSRFDLSGRKPIGKVSHVKFDDIRYSSSLSEHSNQTSLNTTQTYSPIANKSKNSSEEQFYSPEASLSDNTSIAVDKDLVDDVQDMPQRKEIVLEEPVKDVTESVEDNEEVKITTEAVIEGPKSVASPKARRSYKRSLDESPHVRSSPRLSRSQKEDSPQPKLVAEETSATEEPNGKTQEIVNLSPRAQRLHGRKSLSRMVLEHNAFAILARNVISKEVSYSKTENVTTTEISSSVNETKVEELKVEASESIRMDSDTNYQHSFSSSSDRKSFLLTSASDNTSNEITFNETSDYSDLMYVDDDQKQSEENDKTDNEHIKSLLQQSSRETDNKTRADNLEGHEEDKVENDQRSEPVNLYEDLSSGAEDIEEILNSESRKQTENTETFSNNIPEETLSKNETEKGLALEESDHEEVIQIDSSDSNVSTCSNQSSQSSRSTSSSSCSSHSSSSSSSGVNISESDVQIEEQLPIIDEDAEEKQNCYEKWSVISNAGSESPPNEKSLEPELEDNLQPDIPEELTLNEYVEDELQKVNAMDEAYHCGEMLEDDENVPILQLNTSHHSLEDIPEESEFFIEEQNVGEPIAEEIVTSCVDQEIGGIRELDEPSPLPEIFEEIVTSCVDQEIGDIRELDEPSPLPVIFEEIVTSCVDQEIGDIRELDEPSPLPERVSDQEDIDKEQDVSSPPPVILRDQGINHIIISSTQDEIQGLINPEATVEEASKLTLQERTLETDTEKKEDNDLSKQEKTSMAVASTTAFPATACPLLKTNTPQRTYSKLSKIQEQSVDTKNEEPESTGDFAEEQQQKIETPVFKHTVKKTYLPISSSTQDEIQELINPEATVEEASKLTLQERTLETDTEKKEDNDLSEQEKTSTAVASTTDSPLLKIKTPQRTYSKLSKIQEQSVDPKNEEPESTGDFAEEQQQEIETPVFKHTVKKTYLPLMKVKTPRRTYSRRLTDKSESDLSDDQQGNESDEKGESKDESKPKTKTYRKHTKMVEPYQKEDEAKRDDKADDDNKTHIQKDTGKAGSDREDHSDHVVKTTRKCFTRQTDKLELDQTEDETKHIDQSKHQRKASDLIPKKVRAHEHEVEAKAEELKLTKSEVAKVELSGSTSGRTSRSSNVSESKEQPVLKRLTRRSLLIGQEESTPTSTPTRTRSRRSSIKEESEKTPRKRTRSASIEEGLTSKSSVEVEPASTSKSKLRKRTLSTDIPPIIEENKMALRRRRAASVTDLPETKGKVVPKKKASSTVAKRVTRKDSKLQEIEEDETDNPDENIWQLDPIDPIKLLDKSPFKGKPDPEEENVLEDLSPSPTNRRTRKRSASVVSDISLPPSVSVANSPRRERSMSRTSSPVLAGLRTRQRKASTDTAASEVSIPAATKLRKKISYEDDQSESSVPPLRITRSRSNSISSMASMKSDISESSRKVTKRKTKAALKDLPEISEMGEPSENANKKLSTRTRKK